MIFEIYDYINGEVIDQVSVLNFGDLIQKQHCVKPIVFRVIADIEATVTNLQIFLESKGIWKDTDFGYDTSAAFVPSVESGSLSNHFIEVPNATPLDAGGVHLAWNLSEGVSDYLWIDAQVTELADGVDEANFRIFYDFT